MPEMFIQTPDLCFEQGLYFEVGHHLPIGMQRHTSGPEIICHGLEFRQLAFEADATSVGRSSAQRQRRIEPTTRTPTVLPFVRRACGLNVQTPTYARPVHPLASPILDFLCPN